jgi:hypothetical protein
MKTTPPTKRPLNVDPTNVASGWKKDTVHQIKPLSPKVETWFSYRSY